MITRCGVPLPCPLETATAFRMNEWRIPWADPAKGHACTHAHPTILQKLPS